MRTSDLAQGDRAVLAERAPYGGTMRGASLPAGTLVRVAWNRYRDVVVPTAVEWWDDFEAGWLGPATLGADAEVTDVVRRPDAVLKPAAAPSSEEVDPLLRAARGMPLWGGG